VQEQMSIERLSGLRGAPVYSNDGDKIGSVEEIFYDESTRQPEWIGVGTGFLGTKRVLVPIQNADVAGDSVTVPYSKSQVKDSPDVDDDEMDDLASRAGYSDSYSMHSIARKHQRKNSKPLKSSPFEFVSESDMDFENFKNRADFRSEFGGDGELYGRTEDSMSRSGTPTVGMRPGEVPISRLGTPPIQSSNLRSVSRDSDRTLAGTTYPQGYNQTYNPSNLRPYSPERVAQRNGGAQDITLLQSAAPMGFGNNGARDPVSRTTTPGGESARGRPF